MATLRRGLVDKVKKAAAKVSTRGVQVATQAGTRGARAIVETTVAAVKTVDKLQEKLGRRPGKARSLKESVTGGKVSGPVSRQPASRAEKPMTARPVGAAEKPVTAPAKPRRTAGKPVAEAPPATLREVGRKTMPATAPKRSKASPASRKQFKVKRGQKHLHSGR